MTRVSITQFNSYLKQIDADVLRKKESNRIDEITSVESSFFGCSRSILRWFLTGSDCTDFLFLGME